MTHRIKNIIASVILLSACVSANAQAFFYNGLRFKIESDETCSLEDSWSAPKYTGDIVVPEKVVYNDKVYTVTKIAGAFFMCDGLTSVSLPETITTIESQSFEKCTKLTTVNIPGSVTYIGRRAFLDCNVLTGITLPEGLTYLGENAFCWCNEITSIKIPKAIKSIGYATFASCKLTSSVTFHDSLTYIGENAFSGCRFTSLTLPASVDSLGSYAFTSCEWLTEINLDHISKIDTYAFQNNFNLKSANILKAQNVADKSFWECKNIETFVLPYYGWTENFKMDFSSLVSLKSLYIGEGTTYIPDAAFGNKLNLLNVYSNAATPPSISPTTFSYVTHYKGTLYVPKGCIDAYKNAEGWSMFRDFQELPYQVVITDDNVSVDISKSITVAVSVSPADATTAPIMWYSLDEDIATVTADGVVTGVAKGEATLVAFCDGITATLKINVTGTDAVESILTDATAEDSTFDVYNLQGIRVASGIRKAEFSADHFAPGIYILVSPKGCLKIKI